MRMNCTHIVAPKWLIPPPNRVIQVIQGQDVMIDCQASGFPAPRIWWESQVPSSLASASLPASSSSLLSLSKSLTRSSAASSSSTATTTSTTTPSYQPVISNSHIHALENGSLIIKGINRRTDSPSYLCHATNGVGSGISQVVKILICGKSKESSKVLRFDYRQTDTHAESAESLTAPLLIHSLTCMQTTGTFVISSFLSLAIADTLLCICLMLCSSFSLSPLFSTCLPAAHPITFAAAAVCVCVMYVTWHVREQSRPPFLPPFDPLSAGRERMSGSTVIP